MARNPYFRPRNDAGGGLEEGISNLSQMFAPPSMGDVYAGQKAAEVRQKMQGIAAMYGLAQSADMSPEGKVQFDRYHAAAGGGNMASGYYGVDAKNATDQRGQDIASGDHRFNTEQTTAASMYGHNRTYQASRENNTATNAQSGANNTADNNRALNVAIMQPTPENATVQRPPAVAKEYGVPETATGIVSANQGQKKLLPGGVVFEGNQKPMTQEEMLGAIIGRQRPEIQDAIAAKDVKPQTVRDENGDISSTTVPEMLAKGQVPLPAHPDKTFTYAGGTAVFDPTRGKYINPQTGAVVPDGAALKLAAGPTTQVNVDNGSYGTPPKGHAYVRNPDGTIKLGANGAPVVATMEGSEEFDQQARRAKALESGNTQKNTATDIVTQDIDRIQAIVKNNPNMTTGLGAQVVSGVGGTDAHNVKQLLAGIKGNITLDRLQAMRAASPTGSTGLGQVTHRELDILNSSLGSLEQSQDMQQFTTNLQRVRGLMQKYIHDPNLGQGDRVSPDLQQYTPEEARQELMRRRQGGR